MAWDDRSYSPRDNYRSWGSGLWAALSGSVPLYEAFGIAVRIHVALLLYIAIELLLDWKTPNYPLVDRAVTMSLLFSIVLLHEYGHCFMARWTGGSSDRIILWPLGGLALTDPPRRAMAHFLTAVAGPMVNVIICFVTGLAVYALTSFHGVGPGGHVVVSLNPFNPMPPRILSATTHLLYWTFEISYILLLFNLLPIYPLDGGQMAQAIVWPWLGYTRSMGVALITGMVGAVALLGYALFAPDANMLLAVLAIMGFYACYMKRNEMKETAGDDIYGSQFDYSASLRETTRPRKRLSRRAVNRARKIAAAEKAERDRIDVILAKVSSYGMPSLTWRERRALRKATDRQRRRDVELSELGMD